MKKLGAILGIATTVAGILTSPLILGLVSAKIALILTGVGGSISAVTKELQSVFSITPPTNSH